MKSANETLIQYLIDHPEKYPEVLKFSINLMLSDNLSIVNPEEGLLAIEMAEGVPKCSSKMYQDYLKLQNEFFIRYWRQQLAPFMTREAFLIFLESCGGSDMSANFADDCLAHLQKNP